MTKTERFLSYAKVWANEVIKDEGDVPQKDLYEGMEILKACIEAAKEENGTRIRKVFAELKEQARQDADGQ